jgi:hypothetical protein
MLTINTNKVKPIYNDRFELLGEFTILKLTGDFGDNFGTTIEDWE